MIKLKALNIEDAEKEYEAIKKIPHEENGYMNNLYDNTYEEFVNESIPRLTKRSKGIDLPEDCVADTYFFLWDDDTIVGLFKIRHYLNERLRNGSGHVGYSIIKEYRGKGYAKAGLKLALEKAKELVKEDEIYFSVHKDNPASLHVLESNGGYITGEDDEEYHVRIKK